MQPMCVHPKNRRHISASWGRGQVIRKSPLQMSSAPLGTMYYIPLPSKVSLCKLLSSFRRASSHYCLEMCNSLSISSKIEHLVQSKSIFLISFLSSSKLYFWHEQQTWEGNLVALSLFFGEANSPNVECQNNFLCNVVAEKSETENPNI